jgi:hypothetical protein
MGPVHGSQSTGQKTCTQCAGDKVTRKVGARFYFRDHPDLGSAEEQAERAGLLSMTGFDPERTCGKKKCKGAECYACRDAKKGGYQRQGYMRCAPCHGKGTLPDGDKCDKCRGKGYKTTTEFYWTEPVTSDKAPLPFSVTNEIRRADLLSEAQPVKRDRNIAVKVGEDTVMVGPGAIPSRKRGAICAVTGTKRNPYDSASKAGDKKGIGWNMRCRDYKATFSGG